MNLICQEMLGLWLLGINKWLHRPRQDGVRYPVRWTGEGDGWGGSDRDRSERDRDRERERSKLKCIRDYLNLKAKERVTVGEWGR